MQLGGVGSEKSEQMPKKEEPWSQGKHQLIRHLGGQSGGGISGQLIKQAPADPSGQSKTLHWRAEFTRAKTNSQRLTQMIEGFSLFQFLRAERICEICG